MIHTSVCPFSVGWMVISQKWINIGILASLVPMLESKNVFDKNIISKLYATSIKEIVILKKFGNFEMEEIPLSARLVLRS